MKVTISKKIAALLESTNPNHLLDRSGLIVNVSKTIYELYCEELTENIIPHEDLLTGQKQIVGLVKAKKCYGYSISIDVSLKDDEMYLSFKGEKI